MNQSENRSDINQIKTIPENLPNLCDKYERVWDEFQFQDDSEEHFKERESFKTTFYHVKAMMTKLTEVKYVPQQIQFLIIQSTALHDAL